MAARFEGVPDLMVPSQWNGVSGFCRPYSLKVVGARSGHIVSGV